MTGRRENNKNVTPGQWVYLRKEEHPAGVNPKLTEKIWLLDVIPSSKQSSFQVH
jgi:hypothetical protein